MVSSPYFNHINRKSEQDLIDSLVTEAIQIKGLDVYYIPRILVKEDLILGEDVLNRFEQKYQLEMWVKTYDGFKGEGSFIKKFGLEIRDQATIVMSVTRFNTVLGDDYERPREGDLIFFPLTNTLFEIKYVTKETPFYQLGRCSMFECTIELFEYTHQEFNTGVPEIDSLEEENTYVVRMNMRGGAGLNYTVGEYVYQGSSLAEATSSGTVVSYDSINKILILKNIVGTFATATNIIGDTSGANAQLYSYDDNEFPNDPAANNKEIHDNSESGDTEVFNTNNPFGEA